MGPTAVHGFIVPKIGVLIFAAASLLEVHRVPVRAIHLRLSHPGESSDGKDGNPAGRCRMKDFSELTGELAST